MINLKDRIDGLIFNFRIRWHIKRGRESGYSWCCIGWMFIRNTVRVFLPSYNTSVSLISYDRHGNITWKHPRYDEITKFHHVVCPMCKLRYRNKKVKYYTCKPCNWTQFEQQTCNKCGGQCE